MISCSVEQNINGIATYSLEPALSDYRQMRMLVQLRRNGDAACMHLKPLEEATLPSPRLLLDMVLDATTIEGKRRAATRRVASMFSDSS